MGNPITTNPQRSEPVVTKDGLPTDAQIEFNDDIELALNENLLGNAVILPTYKANQSPSDLPDINATPGGLILVTGTSGFIDQSLLVAANTDLSTFEFSITSVTNPGGITQFNFVAVNVGLNRQVALAGFTVNPNYNGMFFVTASGFGFFQVNTITFSGNDTGNFRFSNNWLRVLDNTIVV